MIKILPVQGEVWTHNKSGSHYVVKDVILLDGFKVNGEWYGGIAHVVTYSPIDDELVAFGRFIVDFNNSFTKKG